MSHRDPTADLEAQTDLEKGSGGQTTNLIVDTNQNACSVSPSDMSICLETSTSSVVTHLTANEAASTVSCSEPSTTPSVVQKCHNVSSTGDTKIEQAPPATAASTKNIAKLIVSNHANITTTATIPNNCNPAVIQKVVNPPLITVINPNGPLTVKTLCVSSGVSSPPQFTLVNSAPINVTSTVGKSPTITLLNAPVTVVKAISAHNVDQQQKTTQGDIVAAATTSASPGLVESRGHNVFVKNTCPDSTVPDMPQSHKLLTANNFPSGNVLTNVQTKNGQRSKLKILSNVVVPAPVQVPGPGPGPSQAPSNVVINKLPQPPVVQPQRFMPRQKIYGTNGASAKYLNKPPTPNNNMVKSNVPLKQMQMKDKSPTRMVYPTHKSQIKTLPPMSSYLPKTQGIKTLSPQHKGIPNKVQRSGSGVRTIPPQRGPKLPTKPNYIGKHAVQAQKMRQGHGKMKGGMKMPHSATYNYHGGPAVPEKQMTFNQALTAEIIETLSNQNTPMPANSYAANKHYEILPNRYENHPYGYSVEAKQQAMDSSSKQTEEKSNSGLDALSLICQAVLLDHNYNATLPADPPPRPPPTSIQRDKAEQINGISSNSMYSPGAVKRRSIPSSNTTVSSTSSLSNVSLVPSNSTSLAMQDDDAASDISDGSDRKHDTEGEETDTAPEAEDGNHEEQFDHYGDYVTRCICGFLHDDGYMVECDKCKVWQHVQCVVKNKQVPDVYLCEVCDPTKPIEKSKARQIQQQWLRERQFLDPKLRKDAKVKEAFKPKETHMSDSDSSDGEHIVHNNNVIAKSRAVINRRKSEPHPKQTNTRQRRDVKEVVQRRQKRKERKVVKRKTKIQQSKIQQHSEDENQETWASRLPQLHQWIENYEDAVTNHYSPELRARISSIRVNGAHSELPMQFDSTVHKCRVHTHAVEIKYLVATVSLSPNTPVVELRGKYMLSTQHRNSGGSLTTRQHSQRPGPFLFFYRLHRDNTEVCVDTRTYGNSARFIRRSCKPNAELRHCIEKGVLHLYIVAITHVEKNCELTIKHESHDLAAIGTTQIACACGFPDNCTVNKTMLKKNGENEVQRKRRGRRTISVNLAETHDPIAPVTTPKEEPSILPAPVPVVKIDEEIKEEITDVKMEEVFEDDVKTEVKPEIKLEECELSPLLDTKIKKEDYDRTPPLTPVATRRSSQYKSDKEDSKDLPSTPKSDKRGNSRKLSREERKLEAILRAIEQMEKADQKKQEHQAKQAHRRESEPGPTPKEEEKTEPKLKRRKRKGRARTISTNTSNRRNRLNSTDSYITSGDEPMLSPNDNPPPPTMKEMCRSGNEPNDKAVGLLLALSNGDVTNKMDKSPSREVLDSNSNSAQSSPETQLSSACLLVQAAVEPLESSGFKFPKTKKGLMNEWLNKVPDSGASPSSMSHISSNVEYDSNNGCYSPAKNLAALAQAATFCDNNVQPRGNAKKRWLRQAISEDHGESPANRPDSPPLSEMVAPPKKRRLPRESLSNEASPPTTPTSTTPPEILGNKLESPQIQEGCVEIVYSRSETDSPNQQLESEVILKERAEKMRQEFRPMDTSNTSSITTNRNEMTPLGCLMDPRLAARVANSDHLVGTVEKTLSILGFEDRRPEVITPAKRKVRLSITEYRQRKKLNNNDKAEEQEPEPTSTEENNSSESFKMTRPRSDSTSSSTSLTSTDDDDIPVMEITTKAPAFNSEPTELERQRENSSLRLKKALGLPIDDEPKKPALDVETILNCELPKVKPIPLPSPTFPIPGSCDPIVLTSPNVPPSPERPQTPPPVDLATELPPLSVGIAASPPPPQLSAPMEVQVVEPLSDVSKTPSPPPLTKVEEGEREEMLDSQQKVKPNMFYIPDEEEPVEEEEEEEEAESLSYVPPFNNPVYPSTNFTGFASAIVDDDARYEGRNPSPPPNLEATESFRENQT